MAYFALCVAEEIEFSEPSTYEEAMSRSECEKWSAAMVVEMLSLMKNKTWILVDRSSSLRREYLIKARKIITSEAKPCL